MRAILEERDFPVGELRLLASARSAGRKLPFKGAEIEVQELGAGSFDGVDLVFFAAGGSVSKEYAPQAVAAGATVIDKSSVFRMDPGVPLVVPEVNADHLAAHTGLIATPNCSTIQMVVALKPIYDAAGIERVVVSTYQAVSGSGQAGIAALDAQARQWAAGEPVQRQFYPHQIAFNVLPHIDSFLPSGGAKFILDNHVGGDRGQYQHTPFGGAGDREQSLFCPPQMPREPPQWKSQTNRHSRRCRVSPEPAKPLRPRVGP